MKIENVCKSYNTKILDNIGFEIEAGQCIGILGSNGCGKSTLLSILSGVIKADAGSFIVDGVDILRDEKKRNEVLSFVPQGNVLYPELTVRDNLSLWYDKKEIERLLEEGVLNRLGIGDFIDKKVSKLSGGMKKRASICCCVSNDSKILLLDEPSTALDLSAKAFLYDYVSEYKENGGAVIITTHDVSEFELIDKMYILKDGKLSEHNWNSNLRDLVLSMEKENK